MNTAINLRYEEIRRSQHTNASNLIPMISQLIGYRNRVAEEIMKSGIEPSEDIVRVYDEVNVKILKVLGIQKQL